MKKKQEDIRVNKIEERRVKEKSTICYSAFIPKIVFYQVITGAVRLLLIGGIQMLRNLMLATGTRSAISSGDLNYIMTTPQGWVVILLGLITLVLYMIFDINAMILLSSRILHGEKIQPIKILKEAFGSLRKFIKPIGLAVLFFTAFLIPISGIGLKITATKNLYIPNFVMSFIDSHLVYKIIYLILSVLILYWSFHFIFVFHCVILGGDDVSTGLKKSKKMIRTNWNNFFKRYVKFIRRSIGVGVLLAVGVFVVIWIMAFLINRNIDVSVGSFLYYFQISGYAWIALGAIYMYALLYIPFFTIVLTRIYESYSIEDEGEIVYAAHAAKKSWIGLICAVLVSFLVVTTVSAVAFDETFEEVRNPEIIAHRAGGNLGNENSVRGLQLAYEAGADAAEIDIQRTSDGYYIVNHDNDFKRLANDTRKPSEMTLAEIKELVLPDTYTDSGVKTEFATYEEMLDGAKDRLRLYVELKGETADDQMSEDAYQIAKEKGMLDQVVFISLNYQLISSLELRHPDAETGYLCYAAYGNLEELDVDELMLEEETASSSTIARIHSLGKKVYVWTVNEDFESARFFSRNVDGVITDEVKSMIGIKNLVLYDFTKDERVDETTARVLNDLKRVVLSVFFVL